MKPYSKILSTLSVIVLLYTATSCGDDEGTSCNDLYSKIGTTTGELLSSDCEVLVAAYDKLIDLYDEGRNCKLIKDAIIDEGYTSVDEWLDELQATRDDINTDCVPD